MRSHLDWTRLSRRSFLENACGLGSAALTSMLFADAGRVGAETSQSGQGRAAKPAPHFTPRATRVIHLCMAGGPSQFESFDYKPRLAEMHDEPMPASLTAGQPIAQLQGQELRCFGPQYKFQRFGKCGHEICELFPQLGGVADDLTIIRSMQTDAINHDPAHTFFNTGTTIPGRPAMGSWVLYGLGSECEDLPGFVVLTSVGKTGEAQPIAARQWHSGFLPTHLQGVQFQSKGDAVCYLSSPPGVSHKSQRDVVDAIASMNREQLSLRKDPELETRITQYELAFRMQSSVPSLLDVANESQETLDLYGTNGTDGTFAANCLLARRLVERGVRFVQVYHRGWDHHGAIKEGIAVSASEVDRASAALIIDLKQRGLLDDTIVIWGGEFGRTPMAQERANGKGRDHHIKGYSLALAGGGFKPGTVYGATDELGYNAVDNPVHVHDLHATILHQLGLDHTRLTYAYQGRDFRLTDVHGTVVDEIVS